MKHWINKNYKTLIIAAFLIPIITVAVVSISHVTQWYGISNPITWSVYLSIGIEIAALSALAAISANMGRKVYFPFSIVTLIQFIGNIFFAYSYVDINGESFKMWVELVSPLLEFMGVEPTDYVSHKRFLSLFAGGMLPIISLSFLHMLVKFTEEDRMKEIEDGSNEIIENTVEDKPKVEAKDLVGEISRIRLSENDLAILEKILSNPPKPNENLVEAAKSYNKKIEVDDESNDLDEEIESIISTNDIKETTTEKKSPTQEERKQLLVDIMESDQKLGLYDPPYVSDDFTIGPNGAFEMTEEILEELQKEEEYIIEPSEVPTNIPDITVTPESDIIDSTPLDDEISDWDATLMDGLEDEDFDYGEPISEDNNEIIFQEESTVQEEKQKFSIIQPVSENIFQDNQENNIKVDLSSVNIESNETNENDNLVVRMRDIFLNDEEEKKNLEETDIDQILISNLVDSETETKEESLYWEQENVEETQIQPIEDNNENISSEPEVTITPEQPLDAVKRVFSRNVNNPRRRNFR